MKPGDSWIFGEASEIQPDDAVVVNIAASVVTKAELFNAYEVSLGFPDYFGANWDAFEECIRDLSWVPTRLIVLSHNGLPFADSPDLLAMYISILDSATKKWVTLMDHDIMIRFPRECENTIREILANASSDGKLHGR